MAFHAEFDSAGARLRLRGDCRMADAATLSDALAALRGSSATIDLTGAGDWDIGPAWLLYSVTRSGTETLHIEGAPPRHFTYFDELGHEPGEPAAPPAHRNWLAKFGRFLTVRWAESKDALRFGGRLLLTVGTVWRSVKRLRLPSWSCSWQGPSTARQT